MAKYLPLLLSLLCLSSVVQAQSDTSNYDLGRILVKKQFTQNITVKAHDLERYPFTDLADVINVWFYGTYSNTSSLVYVIDGNIINDVNAYSIYDVDEITLVQNALGQVSGANPGQQMVLIKLKTEKPGKQGITANQQTAVVNVGNTDGAKSSAGLYNQSYLSGFKNFADFSLGLSAAYQRDAFPQVIRQNTSSSPPFNFDRLKLNLWGTAQLGPYNKVTIGVNYAPQASNIADSYTLYGDGTSNYSANYQNGGHMSQHLFNATLAIKSDFIGGITDFSNNFSAAYNHYNFFERNDLSYYIPSYTESSVTTTAQYGSQNLKSAAMTTNFLIRDNLVYHTKFTDFDIDPSLNFSFRDVHFSDNFDFTYQYSAGGDIAGSNQLQNSYYTYSVHYKTILVTPSINLVYKRFLNVQYGFVAILNDAKDFIPGYTVPRLLPFITATADVSKIPAFNAVHLKLFASFSRQNQVLNDEYNSLAGFAQASVNNASSVFLGTSDSNIVLGNTLNENPYQANNNYQGGFSLHIPRNVNINYSFEYRFNNILLQTQIPAQQTTLIYVNDKTITNRIGLDYYLTWGGYSWKTGLSVAQSKMQITNPDFVANAVYANYLGIGHRWSGGFTNRFDYNTFFAGVDVLYQIGDRPYSLLQATTYTPSSNTNYFSLQSLFIGKEIKVKYLEHANIFLTGRNLLQSNVTFIADTRRFFGFGFKAGL